jgi:hypothetical protein
LILVAQIGLFVEENEKRIWFRSSGLSRGKINANLAFVFQQGTFELLSFHLVYWNARPFCEPRLRRRIRHFDDGTAQILGTVYALPVYTPPIRAQRIWPCGRCNHRDVVVEEDLARWTRTDVATLHGIGPSSFPILDNALSSAGLKFKQ